VEASQTCPQCGATLPVHHGFVTWCDKCNWNVTAPPSVREPRTRFERLYGVAGRRLGNRLANELLAAEQLEPRLTPARFAAYAIAVLTHFTTLVLAVGGTLLVALTFPNPAAIVAGFVLVGLAYLMRPRLGKVPDEGILSRQDAPALYGLVDSAADVLGLRHVDVIVIDHRFNATWAVLGVRRRSVLTLGLPLLLMLQPQERVALIGHELAHGRNGDSTRGLVVGSAVEALTQFYWAIAPEHFGEAREWSEHAFYERIVNVLLWIGSRPVLGALLLELHLLLRDSQRAEYLADALAARVAGTRAAVSLEERMLFESTFRSTIQRAAQERATAADLFEKLQDALSRVPDRELERRRRVARLEQTRLSDTHPPTAKRLELLEARAPLEPSVVCGPEQGRAIDDELASRHESVAAMLIDDYRASLYAR